MEFVEKKTSTRKRCPKGQWMTETGCVDKEIAKQQRLMSKKPRKQYTFKNKSKKHPLEQLVTVFKPQTPPTSPHTPPGLPPTSPHTPPGLPLTSEELLDQMFSPRSAHAKLAVPSTIVEEDENAEESSKVPRVGVSAFALKRSASNTGSITPRTAYAKAYFTKPVTLLNTFPLDSESVADHKLLFQVSFTTPDQFTNYTNLSKPGRRIDCLYQSLFSIGLRDVNKAKMDSVEINEKGKKGVDKTAQKEYLKQMFGLRENQIHYNRTAEQRTPGGSISTEMTIQLLQYLCKRRLKDNHTTLIILFFYKNERVTHSHAIIAYKYKGIVYFFDPQMKGKIDDKKIRSRTLTHLAKYSGNSVIGSFSFYMINELPEPREPVNLTCDIPYVG